MFAASYMVSKKFQNIKFVPFFNKNKETSYQNNQIKIVATNRSKDKSIKIHTESFRITFFFIFFF